MGRNRKRASAIVTLAVIMGMAGCSAQYRNHGYVPDEQTLSQVTVGVDTRATVLEVVGAPTTASVLDSGDFYYIRSQVRHFGWKRPEVVERRVIAISFGPSDVVRNIETYGLEDGQVVRLETRVTSSSTADKTFIRQLLGNLGRIDPGAVLGGE